MAPHWTGYLAVLISAAALWLTWWRGNRQAKLIEDANQRAILAEARADASERRTLEETEADLAAPGIAERWLARLTERLQQADRQRLNQGSLTVDVNSLAERKAVELVRARKAEHYIYAVEVSSDGKQATFAAWPMSQRRRLRLA